MKITVYAGDDSSDHKVLQTTALIVQGLMMGHTRIPLRFRKNIDWVGIQTERLDHAFLRKVKLHIKLSMEGVTVTEKDLSLEICVDRVEDSALREAIAEKFWNEVLHRLSFIGGILQDKATWYKNAFQERP